MNVINNIVQVVAPEHVHQVWPKVQAYIESSIATGVNDCTAEQFRALCAKGMVTLLVIVNEGNIIGSTIIEFSTTPNSRIAIVTALGGRGLMNEHTINQVADWCRANGATKFRAWALESQARLYKQKAGFTVSRYVVEKNL